MGADAVVRSATQDDVAGVCRFGEAHIRSHYAPLIGAAAADAQVRDWWNDTHIGAAAAAGLVVVAEANGQLVGVGQRGRAGAEYVVYKLYVHPRRRSTGIGPQMLAALIDQLPADAHRIHIEHFAANQRAGAFYERLGFRVQRIDPSASGDPALDQVWRVGATRKVRARVTGLAL